MTAGGGGGGAAPLSEDASRLAQQLQAVQAELRELRTSVGSQQDEVRASLTAKAMEAAQLRRELERVHERLAAGTPTLPSRACPLRRRPAPVIIVIRNEAVTKIPLCFYPFHLRPAGPARSQLPRSARLTNMPHLPRRGRAIHRWKRRRRRRQQRRRR
eukprot:SAG25_NODE_1280_length_3419_cov_44.074096_3_plen_158_part_00